MTIRIKPATPADAPIILQLIRELAEFERLLHEVHRPPRSSCASSCSARARPPRS